MIHQVCAFGVGLNGFLIEDISLDPPGAMVAESAKVAPTSRMFYHFGSLN